MFSASIGGLTKTASDASSLARAQEILGHDEASTTARHYRRGVAKVTPLR